MTTMATGDQNKRKKLEAPVDAEHRPETKLTDVNDNGLLHIFDYLVIRDLINLSDTCKRLQTPVALAFETKSRGKMLKLEPSKYPRSIKVSKDAIGFSNLTSCLKVLRHFGGMFTKLCMDYFSLNEDEISELASYVNEYGANSLIDIDLRWVKAQSINNWTKPFSSAESIHLRYCGLIDFNLLFPKMRCLLLDCSNEFIIRTFPQLEELCIRHYEYDQFKRSVVELLRLNPQLQKLRIHGLSYSMKFMKSVSGYLQSLKVLDLCFNRGYLGWNGRSIHFKSVKEFSIRFTSTLWMTKIPFTFGQLEKFQIIVPCFKLIDRLKQFIAQNPTLKKLQIKIRKTDTDTAIILQTKEFAKASPSLEVNIQIEEEEEGEENDDDDE